MKRRAHVVILSILSVGAVSIVRALPSTRPPLPEGAYPEWNLAKAWQVRSSKRAQICLNGLWRFRSELRLQDTEVVKTYVEDDFEDGIIDPNLWEVYLPSGKSSAVADDLTATSGFFSYAKVASTIFFALFNC